MYYLPGAINFPLEIFTHWFNGNFLPIRKELVPMGGSGNTGYGSGRLYSFDYVACIGALIWSILDIKKTAYPKRHSWLFILLCSSLAGIAFADLIFSFF